ncbi:MAG: hypothetical protein ACREUC_16915, partial [Steroidobacteraceae bacterium]
KRLRPAAGIAVAAGVAAVAVLSVQRTGVQPAPLALNETASPAAVEGIEPGFESSSYVVPPTASATAFVPATRLTNYVVAHSEYSSPLARRSVLTGVLSEDDDETPEPTSDNRPTSDNGADAGTNDGAAEEPPAQ